MHVRSLTCSSLVCRVEMYPMAPPRNMNMIQKARFLHSLAMVPRKGRRFDSTAEAALGDGGVGGNDERTPHTVRKKPGRAGRNQTRFRRGMSSGLVTRRGVRDWPSTRPRGLDMPRMRVARVRSDSPNQFWLTCGWRVKGKTWRLCDGFVSKKSFQSTIRSSVYQYRNHQKIEFCRKKSVF
jgi:hypothetical protein